MNKIGQITLLCLLITAQSTLTLNEIPATETLNPVNDQALVQSIKNSIFDVISKREVIINERRNGPITAQATAQLMGNKIFINNFLHQGSSDREILSNINELLFNSVIATNLLKSPFVGQPTTSKFTNRNK